MKRRKFQGFLHFLLLFQWNEVQYVNRCALRELVSNVGPFSSTSYTLNSFYKKNIFVKVSFRQRCHSGNNSLIRYFLVGTQIDSRKLATFIFLLGNLIHSLYVQSYCFIDFLRKSSRNVSCCVKAQLKGVLFPPKHMQQSHCSQRRLHAYLNSSGRQLSLMC